MEFEPEEQEIVDLLTKLRNDGGNYPRKLLASRRQAYLSQIASIGAGIGIGAGIKTVAKASKAGTTAHASGISASSLIETVLVGAIVVQASIVAYNYRDNIAEFFKSVSSIPTAVSIPVTGSSLPEIDASESPTLTLPPTNTPSVTATTVPPLSGSEGGDTAAQDTTVTETPKPNDNNGNHFGQTPRPTRENKNVSPTKTKKTGNGNNP